MTVWKEVIRIILQIILILVVVVVAVVIIITIIIVIIPITTIIIIITTTTTTIKTIPTRIINKRTTTHVLKSTTMTLTMIMFWGKFGV